MRLYYAHIHRRMSRANPRRSRVTEKIKSHEQRSWSGPASGVTPAADRLHQTGALRAGLLRHALPQLLPGRDAGIDGQVILPRPQARAPGGADDDVPDGEWLPAVDHI